MGKKENMLITGITVAGLMLATAPAKASAFQMDDAGIASQSIHGSDDAKCGDGKCGDDKKKKKKKTDGSCGEGSCG